MLIDFGTMVAIMIALVSSCFVIVFAITQNAAKTKEITRLQVALRTERRKTK
jgi:hypothetical protein